MNKLKQKDTGFTMVANKPLCDKGLSLSAKGLYAYLRSKPEGWQFSADRIALECLECVRTIKAILQELEDIGLLTRQRKSSGRVDYIIEHKPQCKICTVKNLHGEESAPISNTELNNNTDIYNNTNIISEPSSQSSEVNLILQEFYKINPTLNFGNKTQRKAAEDLIKRFTLEKTIGMIQAYSQRITEDKYMPVATTPLDFTNKLGAIAIKMNQKQKAKFGSITI